ncbi:hypothetical protein [Legionella taurinensis]|uniref:hypothetical protein n=1 Tax=Legionella taurinensis TaxID=70611 RepID=UPI00299E999F|nr:hypothetical protein [Legionella taurinensis]MDX1837305.1 hypothetical protein [Legionella taurinensis]
MKTIKFEEEKFGKNVYIGFTVSVSPEKPKDNAAETDIDIALGKVIDPEKLPYHDYYNQTYLNKIGARRINQCIVVARGDITPPEKFFETGSILPKGVLTGQFKDQETILDVPSHRVTSDGSGVLSCTKSVEVAKNFSQSNKVLGGGYVYLLKGTGAISPTQFAVGEKEYSIPGGVDAIDIIGFRQVPLGKVDFSGSTIYISKDFIAQYPEKAELTLKVYLEKNEFLGNESQIALKDIINECSDFLKLKQEIAKLLVKAHFSKEPETGLWKRDSDKLVKRHSSESTKHSYQEKHSKLQELANALNAMKESKYMHVQNKTPLIQLVKQVQVAAENYQKCKFTLFKSKIASDAEHIVSVSRNNKSEV